MRRVSSNLGVRNLGVRNGPGRTRPGRLPTQDPAPVKSVVPIALAFVDICRGIGQIQAEFGPSWVEFDQAWGQIRPTSAKFGTGSVKFGANSAEREPQLGILAASDQT